MNVIDGVTMILGSQSFYNTTLISTIHMLRGLGEMYLWFFSFTACNQGNQEAERKTVVKFCLMQ